MQGVLAQMSLSSEECYIYVICSGIPLLLSDILYVAVSLYHQMNHSTCCGCSRVTGIATVSLYLEGTGLPRVALLALQGPVPKNCQTTNKFLLEICMGKQQLLIFG